MLDVSTPTSEGNERRVSDRYTLCLRAEAHTPAGVVALSTSSIGPTGLFLVSAEVPPVGFAIHVRLHLPDGPLECVATVVRALPGVGMACRITVPGAPERLRWARFLQALPREIVLRDEISPADPRALFDFDWTNADGPEPV